ncbi:ribbon-helix-helix protein, CopG family [Roseovarius pacificus]|uniref:ribbon-helix-helix protein, CopG family n=1 Tax=Roseovarius pacificus TaxID=337701 RepID=UPI002A18B242|nr:ribbon-helix-helix protein, CopG family [Roseovarius pacificus]
MSTLILDLLEMAQRGRPKTDTSAVLVRLHKSMLDALDAESEKRSDNPTRPEMIRRILADWIERQKIQDSE